MTPEHRQSNGLADNFMRMPRKVVHTAVLEKKDPREEVYKYLLSYRATPHSLTGRTPAELLFNRQIRTPVPMLLKKSKSASSLKKLVTKKNDKMKKYHDKRWRAKTSKIQLGDTVLVRQKKSTIKPYFSPKEWIVVKQKGSMITACKNGKKVTRDASKFRKVPKQAATCVMKRKGQDEADEVSHRRNYQLIGLEAGEEQVDAPEEEVLPEAQQEGEVVEIDQPPEVRRSTREKRIPDHLKDFVLSKP